MDTFWLLLGIKARLLWRSFSRVGKARAGLLFVLILLISCPIWLGLSVAAHRAVVVHGAASVLGILVLVHLGWLFSAFLFAAFTEAFDWRTLLRFPVRPVAVFWINVVLAPVDVVAIVLLPPLAATVAAAAHVWGAASAAGVAAAAVLVVLTTAAVLQILLALLGRLLRREWSRAIAGLALGLAFAAPLLALQGRSAEGMQGPSVLLASLDETVVAVARTLPTTAGPALVAGAAIEGSPIRAGVGLFASALALAALVLLGARVAAWAALAGDAVTARPGIRGARFRGQTGRAGILFSSELSLLVWREIRVWLRTPQVLIGLLMGPFLIAFFLGQHSLPTGLRLFFLPFFCLLSVLNLSANQFGLDREGLRLLLLLPIPPRRLVLAKNLANAAVVAVETALALGVAALVARPAAADLALASLAVLGTLPVVLAAGNALSVQYPWRMTFRIGGTPPGAMTSAFVQMIVVWAMAAVLAVPSILARVGWPLAAATVMAGMGAAAWLGWALSLPRAGRALARRQEHLLDVIARPHEAG